MSDSEASFQSVYFLELPELILDYIITFLSPKACLNLRLTCKALQELISTRAWTTGETNRWKRFSLKITGQDIRTFATAAHMKLPITVFRIQNIMDRLKIYDSPGVNEFLEAYEYCPGMTLTVDVFFMLQPPKESNFYSKLKKIHAINVHNLRVYVPFTLGKATPQEEEQDVRESYVPPPANLVDTLRILTVKDYRRSSEIPGHLFNELVLKFFTSFRNLELLTPAAITRKMGWRTFPLSLFNRKRTYCSEWTLALGKAITETNWNNLGFCVDLHAFCRSRYTKMAELGHVENYFNFLREAHVRGVLLWCVYGPLIEYMYAHWQGMGWSANQIRGMFQFLNSVVSFHGVAKPLLLGSFEMQNLEELGIYHDFAHQQWLYDDQSPDELRFPMLKTLKVNVWISSEHELTEAGKQVWDRTFDRVFQHVNRNSVTKLHLRAYPGGTKDSEEVQNFQETMFRVPIITERFTGLKYLTISGWNAHSDRFKELFSGLPNLRSLDISACSKVEDFPFLHIKGVKKLILELDDMPFITEMLFSFILCDLPLKELRIISKKPLSQLNPKAMSALQQGIFGQNIEHFPFNTWRSKFIKEKDKAKWREGFRFLV